MSSQSNFSQYGWYNSGERERGISRSLLLIFFLKGDRKEKRCRGVKRLSGKNMMMPKAFQAERIYSDNKIEYRCKAGHSYTGLDST